MKIEIEQDEQRKYEGLCLFFSFPFQDSEVRKIACLQKVGNFPQPDAINQSVATS